jgi:transcriptional regulator with XRE-family HTH domain
MSPVRLRLRELRTDRGLSQAQLAERAGLRQSTISELETGTSQSVAFSTLESLAKALGVEPGQLLTREAPGRGKGK